MTGNNAGPVRRKPYSTPALTRTSLSALAERMRREMPQQDAPLTERTRRWFLQGSLTPEGVVALLRFVPEAMSRRIDFPSSSGTSAKGN